MIPEEQFRRTKAITEKFGAPGGLGERLQRKLLQRREVKSNWVNFWRNVLLFFLSMNYYKLYFKIKLTGYIRFVCKA